MKREKIFKKLTIVPSILITIMLFIFACTHSLEIKNLNTYTSLELNPLVKPLSIGIVSSPGDPHCEKLIKGIGQALVGSQAEVILPYSPTSAREVDVLANISVTPKYEGSGWNFLINFPGFFVFVPAWNGYVYKVNYDVDILLKRAVDNKNIDSLSIPVHLNIRHAAINRTWTEVSWFEWGIIAFIGGIAFTQYDDNVSPLVADKIQEPIGDYIAQKIIKSINDSGHFALIRKSLNLEMLTISKDVSGPRVSLRKEPMKISGEMKINK